MSQHHRTELVIAGNLNAVRYREDVLPRVVPFLHAHPNMTLQHDNANIYTLSLLKINAVGSEDISFFAEFRK